MASCSFIYSGLKISDGLSKRIIIAVMFLACGFLLDSPNAGAQTPTTLSFGYEKLGELSVSDFFLEPTFTFTEPRRGRFEAGFSFIEVKWVKDAWLSGVFRAGSTALLGRAARYGGPEADQVGLVEAYAQADSTYGRVRFGVVPIAYGLEGGDAEARLVFPRSLFYSRGLIGLRDLGVSYRIGYGGFFSDWAIHNGESGSDLDNEAWFTARWGWQGGRSIRLGFSGTTGHTSPLSTNPNGISNSDRAGMDVNREAKIRFANAFASWRTRTLGAELEANAGEMHQGEQITKIRTIRGDVDAMVWDGLTLLARYDVLDPNTDATGDRIDEMSIGVAWRDKNETSVLSLIGSRIHQQDVRPDAHQVRVIWRLTPTAAGRLAPL